MSELTSVSEVTDAVADAPATIDRLFTMGGKLIYGTGYTVAFAITFPGALLFAVTPKANALVKGMIDGSAAARVRAQGMVG